ncbi:MAG: hypothetical protein QXN71_03150 [Candidatus Aenigmatarchaeota archaeon]
MKYPDSVLTKNRKGETEVRLLIDRGKFTRYTYIYPDGKPAEGGKISVILTNEKGERTHYFLIPTKGGRYLAIIPKEEKEFRKVWDPKQMKEVGV